MEFGSDTKPSGSLSLAVTRRRDLGDLRLRRSPGLRWKVQNWLTYRWREAPALITYRLLGKLFSIVYVESRLYLKVLHGDGSVTDYGLVSRRVVTNAGVNYLVDAWQNIVEMEDMKYHGFGTGTNAEAAGDTALQTEETTQYNPDNTRPTGTLAEGATANIFRSVGTYSPDSGGTRAITEHGLLSQAATGGGTLWDRSVFSAVNLVAGSDSLQATYEATFTSGG